MKTALILASILFTMNAYSYSSTRFAIAGLEVTAFSVIFGTSSKKIRKEEAALIINDSQIYLQTGTKTVFLDKAINNLKEQEQTLSDLEAVDTLVSVAEAALND